MHVKKMAIHSDRFPNRDYYPFNLDIFQSSGELDLSRHVTIFIGENGSGKSTLLRALSRKCGIYIWEDTMRVRYESNPYQNRLYQAIEIEWEKGYVPGSYFGSEIFQHFTEVLDEWARADQGILDYFGGKSLRSQSHGQSILSFFQSRFEVKGLYFMDEPETALSPASQIKLLDIMLRMSKKGLAQFIMATHSPILMAYPGAVIYSFDGIEIKPIAYRDTEYFKIYKEFLDDPQKFIDQNGKTSKF